MTSLSTEHHDTDTSASDSTSTSIRGKSISRNKRVRQRTGLSNSAMYEAIKDGEFPAPIRLGARAVGWLDEEIDAWIEARIAASRQPKA